VAEAAFAGFGLGNSALRVVVIVLAIGSIPTLVFSWTFEVRPEGLKRETDVDLVSGTAARHGSLGGLAN
jgi:hypothetical protein